MVKFSVLAGALLGASALVISKQSTSIPFRFRGCYRSSIGLLVVSDVLKFEVVVSFLPYLDWWSFGISN